MASDRSRLVDEDGGLGPKDRVVMREETPSTHGCRIFLSCPSSGAASKRGINPRLPQIRVPSKPQWTGYSLVWWTRDARKTKQQQLLVRRG